MKRKVVKLGPATLVVSLPSKWTKRFGVNPGDEIEMEEKDKDIVISVEKRLQYTKEVLDFTSIDHLLRRILASRYIKGVDEIDVHVNSLAKSRIVQKRVDELIGMAVVEQSKDKLIIKTVGGVSEESFHNILNRTLYLLHSISEGTMNAIINKETDLEYLADAEENINKFTDYCFRLLNKEPSIDYKKRCALYCSIMLLEQLGDNYKKIIRYINQHKMKLNSECVTLFKSIHEFHKGFQKLFLHFSFEHATKLAREHDKIMKEIEKQVEKSREMREVVLLMHYKEVVHNLIELVSQQLNIY